MTAYLTFDQWKERSRLAGQDCDAIESMAPGKVASFLEEQSELGINARFRKRYDAPFKAPYPVATLAWLRDLVDLDARMFLGFDPSSKQDQLVVDKCDQAKADIKEAADSKDGLFDLPLRQDTAATGISKGGPLGYSEASPYAWTDRQAEAVRDE